MKQRFTSLSLFVTLLLVMVVGSTSAQTDPRVVAAQGGIAKNQNNVIPYSTLPSSGSYVDIRTVNTQTDPLDPVHPCRGSSPSAGTYSVFLSINHPGGTLNINTIGSNYDTVLSVFNAVGGRASGAAVLCNDDVSPENTSVISSPLLGGEYIIMVSRYQDTVAAASLNLNVNMWFTNDKTPANDNATAPIALTLGVTTVQPRSHLLTDHPTDLGLIPGCEMYNAAWYSFTAPDTGYYRFDTYGTNIVWRTNFSSAFSGIAVHDASLASQYVCQIANANNAVTDALYLPAGTAVLVRVGSTLNLNMLPGTVYSIRPVLVSGYLTANNTDFNDGGTGWTTTGWDGSDLFFGGLATMNAGAVTKNIVQARNNPPSYFKLSPAGTVYLRARYIYTGTATGTIRLRINYNDGTPPTVVNMPIVSGFAQNLSVPVKLTSRNVQKVRVYAILNPGSGQLEVDYLYAEYKRGAIAVRESAGLLTMPDAPGQ